MSGDHTLTAIALTPDGRQTLLYHTTYSVRAPGVISENAVVHQALTQITRSLRGAGVSRLIFVLDRGFDDLKLIRHLRSLHVDFVIRARSHDRLVQQTIKTLLWSVQRLAAAYLAQTLLQQRHQPASLETVLNSIFGPR